jgi:hypothetical protein
MELSFQMMILLVASILFTVPTVDGEVSRQVHMAMLSHPPRVVFVHLSCCLRHLLIQIPIWRDCLTLPLQDHNSLSSQRKQFKSVERLAGNILITNVIQYHLHCWWNGLMLVVMHRTQISFFLSFIIRGQTYVCYPKTTVI